MILHPTSSPMKILPAPPQPDHDPTQSPVHPTPPVPTAATSPAPIPAQPTPMAEQSTPAQASSSKKSYKRTAYRILQPSLSQPSVVDSGSKSLSPPKRHRTRESSQATPPQ
ncbi:vegetative cell wall protein gp1-like [Hibiscus syriacus]|uniref:vegetative cell wall protein gp1-like n=1 Tax=Hibiscus syriacus TaxID=106335 RepID=UPI0019248877|nr:vegetative cell wall protein gp1-like [Hibiscus syriacus]